MSTKPTTQPVKLIPQEESAPRIITTTSGPITTVYDSVSRFGYSRTNGNTNISYFKKLDNFHNNILDLKLAQIPSSIQVLLGLIPGNIPQMLRMLNDKSNVRNGRDDERLGVYLYDPELELDIVDKGSSCGLSYFADPISGWYYQYSSNSCGTNKLTPYGIRAYGNSFANRPLDPDFRYVDKDIPKYVQGLLGLDKRQPQQQVQVPKNNNTTYKILLIVALVIILILSGLIYLMSQK